MAGLARMPPFRDHSNATSATDARAVATTLSALFTPIERA